MANKTEPGDAEKAPTKNKPKSYTIVYDLGKVKVREGENGIKYVNKKEDIDIECTEFPYDEEDFKKVLGFEDNVFEVLILPDRVIVIEYPYYDEVQCYVLPRSKFNEILQLSEQE